MRRIIQVALIVAIVMNIVYWALWCFHRDWVAPEHNVAYYAFENSSRLADLWLLISCVLALITVTRRQPSALLWLICASAAGLYLGLMQLLYDLENDIFFDGVAGTTAFVIVVTTCVTSALGLVWSWNHRGELLSAKVGE